jgi:hypothetical protein
MVFGVIEKYVGLFLSFCCHWGEHCHLFGSLGGTLSQLKVWGGHCQLGGSLRGVCGLKLHKGP